MKQKKMKMMAEDSMTTEDLMMMTIELKNLKQTTMAT